MIPGNHTGDAGVFFGAAAEDDPTEVMAAPGFDDGMDVLSGGEAGAERNGDRSHGAMGAEVALGEDRIDDGQRAKLRNARSIGIDQQGKGMGAQQGERVFKAFRPRAGDAFDGLHAGIDGLAEGYVSADGGRHAGFKDQHGEAAPIQLVDRAGCQVAAAAHDDQVGQIGIHAYSR